MDFTKIISVITTIFVIISNFIVPGEISSSAEANLVKTDILSFNNSIYAGQGITTDGEYYYTSGSITGIKVDGLAKWDIESFKRVDSNFMAIPTYYKDTYQSDHIGGISYYNGYIYAPVEDKPEKNPFILLYNTDDLKFADKAYELDYEYLPDGVPWCAVDAERGYLYVSPFHDVTQIIAYNLDDMSFSHTIQLSEEITRIQGGAVYDGILYLSYDPDGVNEAVYAVDPDSGSVSIAFERYLNGYDNEAESLTVYPMADGSLFHIIDYDKLITVNIRHYALDDTK